MTKNQYITNEKIAKIFDNNFYMAAYIIALAKERIHAGKEVVLRDLIDEVRKKAGSKKEG